MQARLRVNKIPTWYYQVQVWGRQFSDCGATRRHTVVYSLSSTGGFCERQQMQHGSTGDAIAAELSRLFNFRVGNCSDCGAIRPHTECVLCPALGVCGETRQMQPGLRGTQSLRS